MSRLSNRVLSAAALLLAAALAPGGAAAQPLPHLAQGRLNVPVESPGIPAYVRLENIGVGWVAPRNKRWTALVFYRDPACVPPDFDLGGFFHFPGPGGPGAFACPSLVEGHYLYFSVPDPAQPPSYSVLRNRTPALPVWFVDSRELDAVLARGAFTIGEIAALPSLLRGWAWNFEEKLYPAGPNPEPGLTMSASGRLETGGRFSFFWHNHPARGENVFELSLSPRAGVSPTGR